MISTNFYLDLVFQTLVILMLEEEQKNNLGFGNNTCKVKCFFFYLRVSFEVSLVKRLEVALVRAWGRGLGSWWDRVGEVGGAE